jgi:magnesium transporter
MGSSWGDLLNRLRRGVSDAVEVTREVLGLDPDRGPEGGDRAALALPSLGGPRDPELDETGIDERISDCALYESDRRRPGRLTLRQGAAAARRGRGFVWLRLDHPSADDLAVVARHFRLPALAVEDAVKAHQRPKLDVYDDLVFAVLKPVRYVDHDEVVDVTELAAFVGPAFVVTVQHGGSDVLDRVRVQLDVPAAGMPDLGSTEVLYRAADLVVDGYEAAVTGIDEDVDQIESLVFAPDETEDHAERIYKLKREVAEFRRAVLPLAAPLLRLADGEVPVVHADASPYFRDVHDHLLRAADSIEGHDRLLSDVLQANLARVGVRQSEIGLRQTEISVRQNEDMRRISAWAAIGLVPTAVAGVYGMNFDNIPELRWHYGYFGVLGAIVAICVVLHRLFHRNGWL